MGYFDDEKNTEETITKIIGNNYKILDMKKYSEMEKDDSIYFILQKN